jgi:hypothetical protein
MDILTDNEISSIVSNSKIRAKYNEIVDTKSAYEILNQKINRSEEDEDSDTTNRTENKKEEKGTLETILDSPITRQVGRTAATIITRSLLGVLGLGGTTRRKKSSWL